MLNASTPEALGLATKKVVASTVALIRGYKRDNFKTLSIELCDFYDLVQGLVELQLNKKAARRMTMAQTLERSYNFEAILAEQGCAGYSVERISHNA